MKISLDKVPARKVFDTMTILDLFNDQDFSFDFVIAELNGVHATTINKVSDRVYFILEGQGVATVGSEVFDIKKDDLVKINANKAHSISGDLRFIIVTSPPFDPRNEVGDV